MDSSTDEEEEFFESLEDIASSSDAESGGEGNHYLSVPHGAINIGPDASNSPSSKYEVWKNSPGSVTERRQRLFSQMGLKAERADTENRAILVDTAPAQPSSFISRVETTDQNRGNADHIEQRVNQGQFAPIVSAGWTMTRSRSDGTFSRLQNNHDTETSSLRLVRSGTTSPVLHHRGQERLSDNNGAVSRTGSGQGHVSSKPPLGGKRVNGNITPTSVEGLAARKLPFYWSKFGRVRVTDKNGNSLFDSAGLDGKFSDRTSESLSKDYRLPMGSNENAMNSNDGEVLCRIKDLDSGKEFIVNEVGKDGMWNKLKDLDTGREITLEEFESSLGLSPIVQEVMRRERASGDIHAAVIQLDAGSGPQKKKKGWFKAIKEVVRGSREKGNQSHHGSGSDREGSTEKCGRKSGSATDDSQDVSPAARPVKVHAHKKAAKEFADLRLRQEIQAHQGAIWTMKFSLDGSYLATAGQDRVVKVWEVLVHNEQPTDSPNTSGELSPASEKLTVDSLCQQHGDLKKSGKSMSGRKAVSSRLPKLFMLSENAKCAFKGHTEDVLDLSWAPSQVLLSSSMDKTVRLWNIPNKACLKIFAHNDYVTCIQFHPLDDGRFISGSLDGKVRIWSIQEPQVVDWVDLQEMVTAACYTPNGQGAVVGSYKGTCRFYKMSGNKLHLDNTFEVRSNKTKRSQGKKITGFQFVPPDKEKILITSNDSRIRVYDGTEISSKYKGFRNTKSHISASFSSNGRFIICASEDSRVCIWNYSDPRNAYLGQKGTLSGSYEDFSAKHVLVAIPWPGMGTSLNLGDSKSPQRTESSPVHRSESSNHSEAEGVRTGEELSSDRRSGTWNLAAMENVKESERVSNLQGAEGLVCGEKVSSRLVPPMPDCYQENCCGSSILSSCVSAQPTANNGFFSDSKGSATWPEENLPSLEQNLPLKPMSSKDVTSARKVDSTDVTAVASAWGLVIVTAGLEGEIRTFQNYSLPVRL